MQYGIVIPRYTSLENQAYFFPIGIGYVSSSLKQSGRNVFTLNMNYKEENNEQLLINFILNNKIDVIATGGITAYYTQIQEIFDIAKRIKPNIITCVGGGIITSDPVAGMQALSIADYGIIGEGEITICELADMLEGKREINSVNGIIFKNNENYTITSPREEIMDLDTLPYPDYKGFEYDQLLQRTIGIDLYSDHSYRLGMVSFSRSCPFNCTFCFHPSGTRYRRRKLENILKEIDYLIDNFDVKNLMVSDELFIGDMKIVRKFCKEIKKRGIGYAVSLRVDMVNREILIMLKESGCFQIGFGIESADNRILKSMNKHITVEQIENALQLCYEIGINAQGNLIFGDQAETLETANNSIKWWQEHQQYNISLHMIIVYPGSILYQKAKDNGIITDSVKFIRDGCPLTNVSQLSNKDYMELALRISMLSRQETEILNDVTIKYVGYGKVDFTTKCPRCNHINTWHGIDVFRDLASHVCENCNKTFFINVYNYARDTIKSNFKTFKNQKMAFWPMASSMGAIVDCIPELLNYENVYFIDKSKNNICYNDKMIFKPEILKEKDISTVFITLTTPVSHEIMTIIKNEYPMVKKILFAGDLISVSADSNEYMN